MAKAKYGLLLAPGAGADSSAPGLVAVENAVARSKVLGSHLVVARMDFPYRLAGRKAPDRQPVLVEAVRAAHASLAQSEDLEPERIFLGGRSMGGRMCSIAVAEGLASAGLVLMSYPLHPPGKPDKLRVEHLPDIDVPCIFVSGTRDTFGTPDELSRWTASTGGDVTLELVEGGDHGMRKYNEHVAAVITSWLEQHI